MSERQNGAAVKETFRPLKSVHRGEDLVEEMQALIGDKPVVELKWTTKQKVYLGFIGISLILLLVTSIFPAYIPGNGLMSSPKESLNLGQMVVLVIAYCFSVVAFMVEGLQDSMREALRNIRDSK